MQECKECGSSWNVLRKVEVCPFCGADLREKKLVTTIEEAFQMIVERHGIEVFSEYKKLLGLLSDYAPSLVKERKLIKVAVEAGAYKALYEAVLISDLETKRTVKKYEALLHDNYFIDVVWARDVLRWCVEALSSNANLNNIVSEQHFQNEANSYQNMKAGNSLGELDRMEKKRIVNPGNGMIINNMELVKYTGNEKMVVIPDGIHIIRDYVFYANNRMKKVIVPKTVKKIGENSFAYCSELYDVELEEGLEEIGEGAFMKCQSLESLKVPETVEKLGRLAFEQCRSLKRINIPPKIKRIEEFTFKGCVSLKHIEVSRKVDIDEKAFDEGHPPLIMYMDDGIGGLKSTDNEWILKADHTLVVRSMDYISKNETWEQKRARLELWKKADKLEICDGVVETAMECFDGMKKLQEVIFPSTLRKIGFGSFKGCKGLKRINLPNGITTISAHAFENCTELTDVDIPMSVKYIGNDAFSGCRIKDIFVANDCVICSGNSNISPMVE